MERQPVVRSDGVLAQFYYVERGLLG